MTDDTSAYLSSDHTSGQSDLCGFGHALDVERLRIISPHGGYQHDTGIRLFSPNRLDAPDGSLVGMAALPLWRCLLVHSPRPWNLGRDHRDIACHFSLDSFLGSASADDPA